MYHSYGSHWYWAYSIGGKAGKEKAEQHWIDTIEQVLIKVNKQ